MIKFDVLNRASCATQFTAEIECSNDAARSVKLGLAIRWGKEHDANLLGADLRDADLRGANLWNADLQGADLRDADLRGANLWGADLWDANLQGADLLDADLQRANLRNAGLRGANLRGANLLGADLRNADLRNANLLDADLRGANLRGANLLGADLRGADLRDADLRGANLWGADLRDAKAELVAAQTLILPEGDLIGWKQCRNNVLVKLQIPINAKRSCATGRKCRAEFAHVLEIIGAESGKSQHDENFIYRVGETVRPAEPFCEDRWNECGSGIHFYITRIEAENN